MLQTPTSIATVAQVIQLAVAPVFLLAGVGALLGVLINRLGRIVDRFRTLEAEMPETTASNHAAYQAEMTLMARRARMVHWAISLCTICALLVCIVIGALFVGASMSIDLSGAVAGLFVLTMIALVAGLLCFLREISLATGSIHVVPRRR